MGRYMGVGSQMVVTTFVGAAIGWWLDKLTGWSPVFLVVFFFLGSAAGFVSVYRAFRNDGGRRPMTLDRPAVLGIVFGVAHRRRVYRPADGRTCV